MSHVRKKCTGLFITTCLYLQTHWITTIYADEQTSCTDRPNWTDAEMDPCSYYEGVSEDGISFCELFGNCCADEEGFTAQTACCVCGGGSDFEICEDIPNWADCSDLPCAWYGADVGDDDSKYDDTVSNNRCQVFGNECADPVTGLTANDACCQCGGGMKGSLMPTTSPSNGPTENVIITALPTDSPSFSITSNPSRISSNRPTSSPSSAPTSSPTESLTSSPSTELSSAPTDASSDRLSASPSNRFSAFPSIQSSNTFSPSAVAITDQPTASPTLNLGSNMPTTSEVEMTNQPTRSPNVSETMSPTAVPMLAPISSPTSNSEGSSSVSSSFQSKSSKTSKSGNSKTKSSKSKSSKSSSSKSSKTSKSDDTKTKSSKSKSSKSSSSYTSVRGAVHEHHHNQYQI